MQMLYRRQRLKRPKESCSRRRQLQGRAGAASSEYRNGQWLTVWKRRIDARIDPRPFFNHTGKKAQLTRGAANFAKQSWHGQRGLKMRTLSQRLFGCVEAIGDSAKKTGLRFATGLGVSFKGLDSESCGLFDLGIARREVGRLQRSAICGLDA